MLDKHYQPENIEQPLYQQWEREGCFIPKADDSKPAYSIVIPPPNVTGNLHIGHALNNTLQDILIRYHRMAGYDCLWLPGTDHAGIATQSLVEKQMDAEGLTRHDLGREAFIERIWQWKEHSGSNILNQFRRLGASVDWTRECFTMDEHLSRAVIEVFVRLYDDGLIYKDTRLVNWDPVLQTAISDLEVQPRETQGHLWHIRYAIDGAQDSITIATTRPETIFADAAIAVHPDDERRQHLIGKTAILPYTDRRLPIIADEFADPEQGSGAVKISPAHDFNDYQFAKKYDLPLVIVMDKQGRMIAPAPKTYIGMERFEARKLLLQNLESDGLLVKTDAHTHVVPFGERSGQPVEPMLTEQWFVAAEKLSGPAIQAVKSGKTEIFPENWSKTYFDWLENIQPWCISRQLWWGHQIPAWYGPDDKIFVAKTAAEAEQLAAQHYGKAVELRRDPDVLDTWFSSALWAFSPLGWPEDSADMRRFFPTSLLVTGFDIIFFWVARMMMMSLYFTKQVPFETVYVHALVRDSQGQKMSKSKGNVIDPMDLIDEYGCDAMRFALASLAAPGRDIKLSTQKIESARNFATKLWNAVRFAQSRECHYDQKFDLETVRHPIHRWILHETADIARSTAQLIQTYRFHEAGSQLYQFVWSRFCDWYLEFCKNIEPESQEENRAVTAWALEQILHLLHPFMPFITSALYREGGLSQKSDDVLMRQSWPQLQFSDMESCEKTDWLIRLISQIRSVRSTLNLPAGAVLPLGISTVEPDRQTWLDSQQPQIEKLARVTLTSLPDGQDFPKGAVRILHDEAELALLIADAIDSQAEIQRLQKNIRDIETQQQSLEAQLQNQEFLKKAPPHVVDSRKAQQTHLADQQQKLRTALDILQNISV